MEVIYEKYPKLQYYIEEVTTYITSKLLIHSMILFGGIVIDDFSEKYSDIDIVIILDKEMDNNDQGKIDEIIKKLIEVDKNFTRLLYIYFIPKIMLENPRKKFDDIEGLIFGNMEKKAINQYPLSMMDNFSIREKGKILFGKNLKENFPKPPVNCFWLMFVDSLPSIEKASKKYPFQYNETIDDEYVISWLLYLSRMLYSLEKKDIIGKTKGAYWFRNEYDNELGEFIIEIAECREENLSIKKVQNIVKNSRELLIFALEKAFSIKEIEIPDLTKMVNIENNVMNFSDVFSEIRNHLADNK